MNAKKTNEYRIDGKPHEINGVPGKLYYRGVCNDDGSESKIEKQVWVSEARAVDVVRNGEMHVKIRFDDSLSNGHPSFAVTAAVTTPSSRRRNDIEMGGMLHDEIEQFFPEIAPLCKWHLVSSDGPMHYIANTVYNAGDRDHYGKRSGEPNRWEHFVKFSENPVSHRVDKAFSEYLSSLMVEDSNGVCVLDQNTPPLEVVRVPSDKPDKFSAHYTVSGYDVPWYKAPFKDKAAAEEWVKALNESSCTFGVVPVAFSEGKERNLEAARKAASWPEATDEQLMAHPKELKRMLEERLPGLLEEFRSDVEAIGFKWDASQVETHEPPKP